MNNNEETRACTLAFGAVALWSTVAVAFKLALKEIAPLDLVILAVSVSWLSLGVVLLIRGNRKPESVVSLRTVFYSALLGLINPLLYYWMLFAAYSRLPAQVAQPLNYTWPLFLALLAVPVAGKRPTVRDILGLFISLTGVVLIAGRPGSISDQLDPGGIVLALGSGVIWAFSWLMGTRLRMEGTLRLFIGFTAALVVLIVSRAGKGIRVPSGIPGWGAVIWVGLFEMGITFLLWNGALKRTRRPARIGNLVYLGPFISLLWIYLILGESIRPATVAGLGIIISGILIGRGGTAE